MEFADPGPATDPSNPCPWLWVFFFGLFVFAGEGGKGLIIISP